MSARKCQAVNPLKCSDKFCPSKQKHVMYSRDVLYDLQEEIKTSDTDVLNPDYYSALYYELQNTDADMLQKTYNMLDEKLVKVADKINLLNRNLLDSYYETGEQTVVSKNDAKKLEKLETLQRKIETQQRDTLIAYYATFEGNSELKETIRELKNTYPKPKDKLQNFLKLFHEADLQHRKQIIAGLILDGEKNQPVETFPLTVDKNIHTKNEIKLFNSWVEKHPHYEKMKLYGFKNIVDRFGIDVEGEWFTVVPDPEHHDPYLVDAVIPEKFLTMFPHVPDLTLFKETTVDRMVVLRRLRKRKLATDDQLDMLKVLEYNSKKIAELKQL